MVSASDNIRVRTSLISIGVYLLLVVFKSILGKMSGSASVIADAWHSLSDVLVSGLVLVGIKLSARERKGRILGWPGIEHVVSVVIGIFIVGAAVRILTAAGSSVSRPLTRVPLAIAGTFICILISYFAARLKIRIGTREKSPSLVADGYHSLMDMYSSIVVVIGLLGTLIGLELDKIAAVVVALFIAATGLEIIVGAARALAGGPQAGDFYLWGYLRRRFGEGEGSGGASASRQRLGTGLEWLGRHHRKLIAGLCLVLVALWLLSGFYRVQPGERVLIARFGHITKEDVGPGLHYRLPFPIATAWRVSLSEMRRLEIGFRLMPVETTSTDRSYLWESRHVGGRYEKRLAESLIFTGDENIIDINYTIQYHVTDARKYLMRSEDPDTFVRALAEEVSRSVVAANAIDKVLTSDREPVQQEIREHLQEKLDRLDIGVSIAGVRLQDVHPPLEVVGAFRDVASASEDRSRLINEAQSYRNEVIPLSRGEAARMVREAEAKRKERVEHAWGEATRFTGLAAQYRRHADVTALRLYLETMESVLPGLDKFIVEPGAGQQAIDLRFITHPSGEALEGVPQPISTDIIGVD